MFPPPFFQGGCGPSLTSGSCCWEQRVLGKPPPWTQSWAEGATRVGGGQLGARLEKAWCLGGSWLWWTHRAGGWTTSAMRPPCSTGGRWCSVCPSALRGLTSSCWWSAWTGPSPTPTGGRQRSTSGWSASTSGVASSCCLVSGTGWEARPPSSASRARGSLCGGSSKGAATGTMSWTIRPKGMAFRSENWSGRWRRCCPAVTTSSIMR